MSVGAQAGDRADAGLTDIAHLSELLPLLHPGDVHLHRGDGHRLDGVQKGHTGVGIGGGVDDDALHPIKIGLLDGVHQSAFVVGLEKGHRMAFFVAVALNLFQQLGISFPSVVLRLPQP